MKNSTMKKINSKLTMKKLDNVAERLYYESLLLKYLPEIELVKENKIKALKDDEITGFIKRRIEGKEK